MHLNFSSNMFQPCLHQSSMNDSPLSFASHIWWITKPCQIDSCHYLHSLPHCHPLADHISFYMDVCKIPDATFLNSGLSNILLQYICIEHFALPLRSVFVLLLAHYLLPGMFLHLLRVLLRVLNGCFFFSQPLKYWCSWADTSWISSYSSPGASHFCLQLHLHPHTDDHWLYFNPVPQIFTAV